MRSDWFFLVLVTFLTDNFSLQSADIDQQEIHAVAEKPHDAILKFNTYRNLQRHCVVLPAIAPVLLSRTWDSRTRTRTRSQASRTRTWKLVLEYPRGQGLSSRTTTL